MAASALVILAFNQSRSIRQHLDLILENLGKQKVSLTSVIVIDDSSANLTCEEMAPAVREDDRLVLLAPTPHF